MHQWDFVSYNEPTDSKLLFVKGSYDFGTESLLFGFLLACFLIEADYSITSRWIISVLWQEEFWGSKQLPGFFQKARK